MKAKDRTVFLLATALLQAGCAFNTPLAGGDRGLRGKLQVTSGALGNAEVTPAACTSGQRQLFLGADFLDSARGITLRLILAPTGDATLRVFNTAQPLNPGVSFHRNACRKFQVSFDRTGWRIDDIYAVRVSLDVDCGSAPGDSVQGMLAAASCH